MGIKYDCFAYKKELNKCSELNQLYCAYTDCEFYKTKEERCKTCMESWGRILTCRECKEQGY